jgi:glycosyltransferase involved in cell wall biosynthesis
MQKPQVVFIYNAPHYLHHQWVDSVGAKSFYYSSPFAKDFINKQIDSFIVPIPDADIYIVEGVMCLGPVIRKKMLGSKAKVFCINSDTLFYDYPKYSWLKKEAISFYLGFIDCFISTSKYVKSLAEKVTKIPHVIAYPYVDYKKWSKVKTNLNNPDIVYIGNICHFRGTDLLLDAFKNDKDINIKLIGRWSENIPLSRNVSMTMKRVKNPEKYMSGIGNYINPSRHDSFGINVLEAMAMGLAPIVSENVGAKEILPKELIAKLNPKDIRRKYINLNKNGHRKKHLAKVCKMMAKTFTKKASMDDFKSGVLEKYYG